MLDDATRVKQLKSLAHPDRLRLLRLLSSPRLFPANLVDPRTIGICVNDLAKAATLPQSTTSYHLSLLQDAGLVTVTEHGQWRYTRIDTRALSDLCDMLSALGS